MNAITGTSDPSDGATSTDDAFVHLRGVRKDYGARRILEGVDLGLDEGEFLTLVGPSGCGKSMLLRLVLGQERPTAGTITIDGETDARPSPKRGVVYQQYTLFPHLTVLGNVMLPTRLRVAPWSWRTERARARSQAMALLERVRLADSADRYPHQLSGGMRQRAAIAKAIAGQPRVLLMDEPFAALDAPTRRELQGFMRETWRASGATVVFVTQDVDEALTLGTRIALLTQYHAEDAGHGAGARIVLDRRLDPAVFADGDRESPAYQAMRARILVAGFDPTHRTGRDDVEARIWRKRHPAPPAEPAREGTNAAQG